MRLPREITPGQLQKCWNDAKWAGEIILPPAFFNYIIICLTTSFKKNDVVNVDDEYNECYYLNASLYPLMSKLMIK